MRANLLAAILAATSVISANADPYPHAEPPAPALPTGPLQLFGGNDLALGFIVLDETKQTGTVVDAWIFKVMLKPYSLTKSRTAQNTIVQLMDHVTLDCAKRDAFILLSDSAFNSDGQRVVWLPRHDPEPIDPGSMQDHLAQVVCDHHPLPPSNTVIGHEAAIRAAHIAIQIHEP